MKIEQIYTGCLAQGAYYIESNGEAAIIDPLRETQPYIDRLTKDGVSLKYIFETHFHADFVSGHLDLSKKTGAPIVYGPTANPEFEAIVANDGQLFTIGNIKIKVLHTPGHTLESTTYLLIDEQGKETAIFSGDTLFLGDVGRPDLAQKAANMSKEDLAGMLYDSLYTKILPLADDVTVYPAHGAGSACGKNMMKETVDTLGNQKKMNYALNQPSKQAFIEAVTDGLLPPPAYFGMNVAMNKKGYQLRNASIDSTKPNKAKNTEYIKQLLRSKLTWSNTCIVLIGPKTHSREWVNWEIEQAYKKQNRIVGVYINGASGVDLPENFNKYGDALVGWNSKNIESVLEGENKWYEPNDTPRINSPYAPSFGVC